MKKKLVFYPVAEAKAKLSEVIDETKDKHVIITRNGKPTVVIINYEQYEKMMEFIEKVWDLYLLEIGDPSVFKDLKLEDLFDDED